MVVSIPYSSGLWFSRKGLGHCGRSRWCFNPVFIRSLIFTVDKDFLQGFGRLFQSRIHPVSDFHLLWWDRVWSLPWWLFQSRIHPVSDFHAVVGPSLVPTMMVVSIPYSSGLWFSLATGCAGARENQAFQSRIHPVSDFHLILESALLSMLLLVSIPYSSGLWFSQKRGSDKSLLPGLFQSRIHPVSDFHKRKGRSMPRMLRLFQSRIHPVSDFHWRSSIRLAPPVPICFNPVFIRSLIFTNYLESRRTLFRKVSVSIPYSSGLWFSQWRKPRNPQPSDYVSIPYSSGLWFSRTIADRLAGIDSDVSIPYSSGLWFSQWPNL